MSADCAGGGEDHRDDHAGAGQERQVPGGEALHILHVRRLVVGLPGVALGRLPKGQSEIERHDER